MRIAFKFHRGHWLWKLDTGYDFLSQSYLESFQDPYTDPFRTLGAVYQLIK